MTDNHREFQAILKKPDGKMGSIWGENLRKSTVNLKESFYDILESIKQRRKRFTNPTYLVIFIIIISISIQKLIIDHFILIIF